MKKRYYLSLDKATVDEFQAVAKSMGMASNIVSLICDEALAKTLAVFKQHVKKSLTLVDLFTMIGKEMQADMGGVANEAKKDVQQAVGKKAVEAGKATAEPVHKQRSKRV